MAKIVEVCWIFHNIALQHELEQDATEFETEDNREPHVVKQGNAAGLQACAILIQSHFLFSLFVVCIHFIFIKKKRKSDFTHGECDKTDFSKINRIFFLHYTHN